MPTHPVLTPTSNRLQVLDHPRTLSGLVFLASLENTIIGSALPSIVRDLNIGSNCIWVAHIQMLAGTALMPLVAQLANILERRWITLIVTVIFIIGSALCGAATNEALMLAGRALQMIPYTAFMFPSVIFTAVYKPKLPRYKALHVVGFIIMTAGQGLLPS